jgi:hypothetical protein
MNGVQENYALKRGKENRENDKFSSNKYYERRSKKGQNSMLSPILYELMQKLSVMLLQWSSTL